MRDRRYQSTEKGLDDLADLMLNRINSCVDDRTKKAVKIKSAIVTKVNDDGTVNVQLPNEDGSGFSRLQNQSVYELNVGDSVEILLKEGSFTNSWVIAKHGGGTKRVNLVNQGTLSIVTGRTSSGGGSSGGGSSGGGSSGGGGSGSVALEQHILNHSNPHVVTKAQIGLDKVDNEKQYSVSNPPPYPVSSVNSKTRQVVLTAKDVGALPDTTKIPTKTSELDNDSEFLTKNDANYPVTKVNNKTGEVMLSAVDVGALPTSGGTLTGNLQVGSARVQTNGYVIGTWLQGTAQNHLGYAATKIAVQDASGWVYHRTAKEVKSDIGLGNVDNVKQYSASNPPPYPVTSINGKTGAVQLSASDVGAVDSSKITTTLTDSNEQIPTSKAVADAMSASGYGDMLKAKYAPNSEDTVEKAYKDEDGNNIKDTYQKKGGVLTNTDVNIVIESGNYFLGSGNTNIPNDCEGNVMMVGGAGNAAFQAIFKFSTNSIVHRCYNGTSWTAWRDTNTALIVSATQPTNQSPGDLWYQIVE